jgi:hypothetical protein
MATSYAEDAVSHISGYDKECTSEEVGRENSLPPY